MNTRLCFRLRFFHGVLLLALWAHASTLMAATVILDDSQSQVIQAQLPMQWRSISPSRGDHQVIGSTRVQVRLNTQAWIGQTGRIFMALPAQPSAPVQAQWQTQGMLLPGQLQSGSRTQIWAGKITQPLMEDVMTVIIHTDGRHLQTQQLLRFHFELDLP
jgi:hypothetical protein